MFQMRRDGLRRQDAVLDAALRVFIDRGVAATGIEDIRKAAGASPSSIYHHFGGLEGVTLALLTRTFTRLFGELAAKVTRARTAEAAIKALVRAQLDWVFAHEDEARFMYQAMALELGPETGQVLAERKAELLRPVVEHVAPFIARGELPRWSPLIFDVVLLGPTHEACRRYLGGAPLTRSWMRANLPALAWRALHFSSQPPGRFPRRRRRSARLRG